MVEGNFVGTPNVSDQDLFHLVEHESCRLSFSSFNYRVKMQPSKQKENKKKEKKEEEVQVNIFYLFECSHGSPQLYKNIELGVVSIS